MTLTGLAEKTIVYQAAYNDCIYESSFAAISIHKTREGAERAIKNHRRREVASLKRMHKEMKEIDPNWDREELKIKSWQKWDVFEIELKD